MIRTPIVMALGLLAACARPAPVPSPGAQDERFVGVPSRVGSAPANARVVLAAEGGERLYLTGPLAREVGTLAGARVEVRGRRTEQRTLEATDYDVLAVNGRPAVLGTVERGADGALLLRTRDGRPLRIQNPPDAFRPGMRVWVQGPGAITVQAYGVVRQ